MGGGGGGCGGVASLTPSLACNGHSSASSADSRQAVVRY